MSQIAAASELEVLDRGFVKVLDGATAASGSHGLTSTQRGRARPLHWVAGTADETETAGIGRQGCNSIVFAIEARWPSQASPRALNSGPLDDQQDSAETVWQGVLKGALPVGRRGDYYKPVAESQQMDWLLPVLVGERRSKATGALLASGSPNVLAVKHAFLGSSQLLAPWLPWINE